MNEILAALVKAGEVQEADALIYTLFHGDQMMKHLAEVRSSMFMKPPRSLDANELAWRDGNQDFVRNIFEVVESVSFKIKTEGKECQNYLTPEQQKL